MTASDTIARRILATAATVVAATAMAASAYAEDLIVKFDQSQILRLPRPAAEIIVGNPSIADVAIQSGNILVVTGKSFGITNIIALDAERNVIQDQRVAVRRMYDIFPGLGLQFAQGTTTYQMPPGFPPPAAGPATGPAAAPAQPHAAAAKVAD